LKIVNILSCLNAEFFKVKPNGINDYHSIVEVQGKEIKQNKKRGKVNFESNFFYGHKTLSATH
jgi:hypothetical protein